ncbi:hypothetical protein J2W30_001056 [Variovorax boronicumulans]|jgi:hypothetical protein|uniref:hypothetical protein n=1 Tax=Variovorax boronicumulans TaxID=436515 RepID=UPI0027817381|nr:hypothetical protein [Variovorax boronicumulans]MDQ0033309.1 hypothetical protein [Variovorax boronicumulans]
MTYRERARYRYAGYAAAIAICVTPLHNVEAGAIAPSLCAADEVTYFSCQIKRSKKVASLCGPSIIRGFDPGAELEYRYGRPSSIELRLPSFEGTRPVDFFRGEHLNPHGESTVVDSVLFSVGDVSYGITVREGRNKFIGVWKVEGKKYEERSCAGKAAFDNLLDLILKLPTR